jgi:hypothetical protein
MPGRASSGPLPPLTPGQEALSERLRRHVVRLAGDIGERNVAKRAAAVRAATVCAEPQQWSGWALGATTEFLGDLLARPAVMEAVTDWAASSHPPTALRILRLCHKATWFDWVAAAMAEAASRVPQAQELTVDDLSITLRALWYCDFQLPRETTVASDLLDWIGVEGLDQVLAQPSRVSQRYTMSYWMLRHSRRSDTTGAVVEWLCRHATQLLAGADPRRSEDLIYIRRLSELLDRAAESQYTRDGVRLRPLEQQVQGLLKQYPDRDVPLAAVLSWMSLRLHFDGERDWNSLIDHYAHQVRSGLAHADPIQVSKAFGDLARSNGGMCTRLFNRIDLSAQLVSIMKSSSPEAAAMLISTIRKIHGKTVKSMLYRKRDGSWIADADLVRHLADTVIALETRASDDPTQAVVDDIRESLALLRRHL